MVRRLHIIRHPYGMDKAQAKAMVRSYNDHLDACDRCCEMAYTADSDFDNRLFGGLANEHRDMSCEALMTLLHYGYSYKTVDDCGHIALAMA